MKKMVAINETIIKIKIKTIELLFTIFKGESPFHLIKRPYNHLTANEKDFTTTLNIFHYIITIDETCLAF